MSDDWETPKKLYEYLKNKYRFYPTMDVCAIKSNRKCSIYCGPDSPLKHQMDGLEASWHLKNWCNPPHSNTEEWVKKALWEFEQGHETMMIIPACSMCTDYAEACILPHSEYYPINRRFCKFLQDGEEKDPARNGYFVVFWRKPGWIPHEVL